MKFKLALGTTFGAVLIGSLIAHVPASWLWQQMPPVKGLMVAGISGTPWQGVASQVRWQEQNLGRVQWDMSLAALLTGKASFAVRFGKGSDLAFDGRGTVGYGTSGAFAENLLVSVPAQNILKYARAPIPATVTGNLELTVRDYQYQAPYCSALDGSLAWTSANIRSPLGEINPGPVIADLGCEQGQLTAQASQSSADISSDWQASLAVNQSYSLNGWFKPGAEFPPQLGQQLKWLGNPDSKGRYKIAYSGRL
ncbi:type II secretion system protein N [Photobacterium sagamiensis]|uniref:type II secretion system protein N n=1 Tax=Photobacterium sagamiensis TaxID=2910241 RepID=UPI003D0DD9DC